MTSGKALVLPGLVYDLGNPRVVIMDPGVSSHYPLWVRCASLLFSFRVFVEICLWNHDKMLPSGTGCPAFVRVKGFADEWWVT